MKKILYRVFKVINWVIPFVLLFIWSSSWGEEDAYCMIIFVSYLLFVVLWLLYSHSRSRWLYQIWIFVGFIYAEYSMFSVKDTLPEILEGSIEKTTSEKIILTLIAAVALISKIFTMMYETKSYKAGAGIRHNNKLDDQVNSAAYELEHAKTTEEKWKAEARLERAKLDKKRYSWDEDQ